jgi:hypothetical protein
MFAPIRRENFMRSFKTVLALAALALSAFPLSANAAALSIVNVGAPAINCVFNTSCTVTVSDSIGNFTPPGDAGNARLQSRTYPGLAPAPAAGDMAYVYRVDMTQVQGVTAVNCVTRLRVIFGPDVKLPYSPSGNSDIFVVTAGGLGSVGLSSATLTGNLITFIFSSPVCPGQTSYFFGIASKSTMPVPGKATVYFSEGGLMTTNVRAP